MRKKMKLSAGSTGTSVDLTRLNKVSSIINNEVKPLRYEDIISNYRTGADKSFRKLFQNKAISPTDMCNSAGDVDFSKVLKLADDSKSCVRVGNQVYFNIGKGQLLSFSIDEIKSQLGQPKKDK